MSVVEQILFPRAHDLGGLSVRRILPHADRRMVGPFIFLDHMGPATFSAGKGIDVRPHPHIGLATVTYLFEGELFHRDSLGNAQEIKPGEVNWMTAGRGIVHSERTGPEERQHATTLHGLQSWVALPLADEETEPEFFHHPASAIPFFSRDGVTVRLIAGKAFGLVSPVRIFSPLFYADIAMAPSSRLSVAPEYAERALYILEGELEAGGEPLRALELNLLKAGAPVLLESRSRVRAVLLGGDPFGEPRQLWWNFVASSSERIEQAKRAWKNGAFPPVPGDTVEFIPLPED